MALLVLHTGSVERAPAHSALDRYLLPSSGHHTTGGAVGRMDPVAWDKRLRSEQRVRPGRNPARTCARRLRRLAWQSAPRPVRSRRTRRRGPAEVLRPRSAIPGRATVNPPAGPPAAWPPQPPAVPPVEPPAVPPAEPPTEQAPPEMPIHQRSAEQAEAKRRIGQATAELISDGETVFISSGTTTFEVARALAGKRRVTVITNALNVANALINNPNITLVILGGLVRRSELSLTGYLTEHALKEVRADTVIMGIHALHPQHGLTNEYLPETMTDR